jgi:hypothetical protein
VGDLGAYGLRIEGLPGAERWMQPQEPDAPLLKVVAERAAADPRPSSVTEDAADIGLLDGGRIRARRGEPVVRFALPQVPPDGDLLHPYLAPAAALFWQWSGHEALHAGAVDLGGQAVLLIGAKETGKSTTIAHLAERGITVIADDLAVLDDGRVLAGPRSIDLRGADGAGDVVRDGERTRLTLPAAPAALPVGGCAVLRWGSEVGADPVAPAERVGILASERSFYRLAGDPSAILHLAGLPMIALTRPQERSALEPAAEALLQAFA